MGLRRRHRCDSRPAAGLEVREGSGFRSSQARSGRMECQHHPQGTGWGSSPALGTSPRDRTPANPLGDEAPAGIPPGEPRRGYPRLRRLPSQPGASLAGRAEPPNPRGRKEGRAPSCCGFLRKPCLGARCPPPALPRLSPLRAPRAGRAEPSRAAPPPGEPPERNSCPQAAATTRPPEPGGPPGDPSATAGGCAEEPPALG